MTRTESTGSIVIYFAISGTLFSLAVAAFGWVVPDRHDALLLVAIGLLGGIGQILMTSAYRARRRRDRSPRSNTSRCSGA